MATILIHPKKDQLEAVKSFLKSLKVPFEETEGDELPDYVVEGFKRSQKDFEEGRFKKYTGVNDLFRK